MPFKSPFSVAEPDSIDAFLEDLNKRMEKLEAPLAQYSSTPAGNPSDAMGAQAYIPESESTKYYIPSVPQKTATVKPSLDIKPPLLTSPRKLIATPIVTPSPPSPRVKVSVQSTPATFASLSHSKMNPVPSPQRSLIEEWESIEQHHTDAQDARQLSNESDDQSTSLTSREQELLDTPVQMSRVEESETARFTTRSQSPDTSTRIEASQDFKPYSGYIHEPDNSKIHKQSKGGISMWVPVVLPKRKVYLFVTTILNSHKINARPTSSTEKKYRTISTRNSAFSKCCCDCHRASHKTAAVPKATKEKVEYPKIEDPVFAHLELLNLRF